MLLPIALHTYLQKQPVILHQEDLTRLITWTNSRHNTSNDKAMVIHQENSSCKLFTWTNDNWLSMSQKNDGMSRRCYEIVVDISIRLRDPGYV